MRERKFLFQVQAVWPDYFMRTLRETFERVITLWPGMRDTYNFAVPCPGQKHGKACEGTFALNFLHTMLERGITKDHCRSCYQLQDIESLLHGFKVEDRQQLDRLIEIGQLLPALGDAESRISSRSQRVTELRSRRPTYL